MRLMHLGFYVYVFNETIAPPVRDGDIIIIISKIDKWLKEKETKRKVKYFPVKRDHRVIKKQEALEAKRLKKEQKKQKKNKKNSDDDSDEGVRINEPDGFTESKDLMD